MRGLAVALSRSAPFIWPALYFFNVVFTGGAAGADTAATICRVLLERDTKNCTPIFLPVTGGANTICYIPFLNTQLHAI